MRGCKADKTLTHRLPCSSNSYTPPPPFLFFVSHTSSATSPRMNCEDELWMSNLYVPCLAVHPSTTQKSQTSRKST